MKAISLTFLILNVRTYIPPLSHNISLFQIRNTHARRLTLPVMCVLVCACHLKNIIINNNGNNGFVH